MMNGSFRHAAIALLTAASLMISPVYAQAQDAPAPAAQAPPAAPAPAMGQTRNLKFSAGPDYSKGPRWFPNITAPYRPLKMPEPPLANSPRIGQLIQDGQLMLSLEDAISLALENNMDIAVQEFTPWLAQAALLRAKSGINNKTQFDPSFTGNLSMEEQTFPINNPFLAGVGTGAGASALVNHNTIGNFGYTQGFHTGTQLQVTFNNTRSSTTSSFNSFNPSVQSSLQVQLTQPLLNGFGKLANTRYILEAKNTVKVGESQFSQQVIATVTQVATDYWELVYARESVKVQESAVAVSKKLYEDNKKQLEIGTMAPLDVLTAESQLVHRPAKPDRGADHAAAGSDQSAERHHERSAGRAAGRHRHHSHDAHRPAGGHRNDFHPGCDAGSVAEAAGSPAGGPELEECRDRGQGDAEFAAAVAQYFWDVQLDGPRRKCHRANAHGGCAEPGQPNSGLHRRARAGRRAAHLCRRRPRTRLTPVPGGIGESWDQLGHSRYPTFQGGINLTLPVRNRAAQADSANALLNQRQQEAKYRQLQNAIFLSVRNAQIALAQGRGQVAAAEKARSLAQQTLDDEQKKYQLGASTSYNVVLRERDLTAAQGTELRARINLIEAEVNFNQAMGRTLDVNRIVVAGGRPAGPAHVPNIPGAPDAAADAGN